MPIIAIVVGWLTKFLTDRALMFIATKALLITLFMTVLPFILKGVFEWIMVQVMELVETNLAGYDTTFQSIAINLTGVGAYLGNCLQLDICFSLLISAILLRITLNFVPFVN
jgi:hypothetical protein